MIRDVTFGQFFPGKSLLHKLDARVKILLVATFIVIIFIASNYISLAITLFSIFFAMILSKIPIKTYLKSIKMITILVLATSLLNIFYGEGTPLFNIGFITITKEGINNSIFVAARLIMLVIVSSLLTLTTLPTDLTDAIERIISPLKLFKVKTHEISMMMTIALRFIPTLIEETDKIMNAQKARGADIESGNLIQRIRALVPILIPLFVSAFKRAYDLAIAMECRCYNGGDGRSRMKILKVGTIDYFAIIFVLIILILVLLLNIKLPVTMR